MHDNSGVLANLLQLLVDTDVCLKFDLLCLCHRISSYAKALAMSTHAS